MTLPLGALTSPGVQHSTIRVEIPPTSFGGEYALRYGLYNPARGGHRIRLAGNLEGGRVRGGKLVIAIDNGQIIDGHYVPEQPLDSDLGLNREQRLVDFGPIVTNGAYRLLMSDDRWMLIPLPNSMPIRTRCRLAQLGVTAPRTATLAAIDLEGNTVRKLDATVSHGLLDFTLDAEDFAYIITFSKPLRRK